MEIERTAILDNANAITLLKASKINETYVVQQSSYERCNENNVVKPSEPVDGGVRAWIIIFCAFLCNGIIFGQINTFGVIYLHLQKQLKEQGDANASTKVSLLGSFTIGVVFILSPLSGILVDKIGLRKTIYAGGCFAFFGMILSAAFSNSIFALYFTYGLLFGFGAALTYTPLLTIPCHYFKGHLGIASGIVASGSSVFTIVLPPLIECMLVKIELTGTFAVLGVMTFFTFICAIIFKPMSPQQHRPETLQLSSIVNESSIKFYLRKVIYLDNWTRKKYIIWCVAVPIALIGYYVPYVHVGKLVEIHFPASNSHLPIVCIGISSTIGRILIGFVADIKCINRIVLQQTAFCCLGVLVICMPHSSSFTILLLISLAWGFFEGVFLTVLAPIAYDICGSKGATQAIGFLLGICALPLVIGSPLSGLLYDKFDSYKLSFVLPGIPQIIGAIIMCYMHCVKDYVTKNSTISKINDDDDDDDDNEAYDDGSNRVCSTTANNINTPLTIFELTYRKSCESDSNNIVQV